MKLGTPGFIGEKLREAREARGLTATALASVLGVSAAAIAQYEAGSQTPRPEVMDRIRQTLRQPLSFFMDAPSKSPRVAFFRSLQSATKIVRTAAERRLVWVQDIASKLTHHLELRPLNIPEIDVPSDPLHITDERIEKAARECRKYWGLGEEPIKNVAALLENNGAVLARDNLEDSLDALSMRAGGRVYCLASTTSSSVRCRYNLLHELAHMVLHRNLDRWHLENRQLHKIIEKQAFKYAAYMSLPTEAFAADVYSLSLDSFIGLKGKWLVSIAAMIMRCEDLGIIKQDFSQKLWRNMAARGWRTEEPLDDEIPHEDFRMLREAIAYLISNGVVGRDSAEDYFCLSAEDIDDLTGSSLRVAPKSVNLISMLPRNQQSDGDPSRESPGKIIEWVERQR